jgi:hypothetical protein
MARRDTEILDTRKVRRQLAARGDIRGEVALQNDVNSLLARLEREVPPWVAMEGVAPMPDGEEPIALPRNIG